MENKIPKNKFMPVGKSKLVNGTIALPELADLCLIVAPVAEDGKADGELYDILDKKWKKVKAETKGWFSAHFDFKLGNIHATSMQSDVWVVNALCYDKKHKLDEKALVSCMKKLYEMAKAEKASVHISIMTLQEIPQLEELVPEWLLNNGVNCYFYEEKEQNKEIEK